jgi:phospholipid/cholesterol/gamma-HCH transport system substrate-binding protein
MAQRRLTWTDLRVGLFVLVGLIVVALGIFYVTGQRGFWTAKYRLKTYLPEVEDLTQGAPVSLDGVIIGNVESIALTPHPADKNHSITLVMRLERTHQNDIRTDSTASLVTQGLLGNRYVSISRGFTGSVIPPGGVVPGGEIPEIKDVVERGADVAQNLQVLSTQLNDIVQKVNRGEGSIGKFMNDPSLYNHLNSTATKIDSMITSVQQGNGSVGKLVASDEMYNKVNDTVGKIDDAMTAIRDQKGTMGKLVYDPAIADNVKGLAEKGNALFSDIRAGKGTLGKFATDDTAYNELKEAAANVKNATEKLNSNEGTLGKMFSDPAFYDNMTGLSGDMRLLITDFRRNPKKFLQIKLGIF